MCRALYPYEYVDSVFCIDYGKLYRNGCRCIIFDIDNTLVHHGDDSTPRVDGLFSMLKSMGFSTLLLTDNDEQRVRRFVRGIDTMYIYDASKPAVSGYKRALELLGADASCAVVVGDQIFKDIYGANKSGIASILVKFIRLPDETAIGKRRQLERLILHFYGKSKKYRFRLGDIHVSEAQDYALEQG